MTALAARQAILSAIEQHQAVPVPADELKRLRESHAELLAALKALVEADETDYNDLAAAEFQAFETQYDEALAQARVAVSHATQPRPDQSEGI